MNAQPCECCAYPFPHRPGGGECRARQAFTDVCEPGEDLACPTCEHHLETSGVAECRDGRVYYSRDALREAMVG